MGQCKNLGKCLKSRFQTLLFFFFGAFMIFPFLLAYVLITIPAIVYQWFVTKILLKSFLCPVGVKRIVTSSFGTAYADEYISTVAACSPRPSRTTIVQQTFVSGIIPLEECVNMIRTRWLDVKKSSSEQSLKYPELKQYVVSWMGYLFWKEDSDFKLENHLAVHIPQPSDNLDKYCTNFLEDLLNKPFRPKKSPWEIHLVYSCNCSQRHSLSHDHQSNASHNAPASTSCCHHCGKEEMTVVVTRIHHCLGDGMSFMLALEELFGSRLFDTRENPIDKLEKTPNCRKDTKDKVLSPRGQIASIVALIEQWVSLCRDLGCVASFVLWRANNKTELHLPDDRKIGRHLYERSHNFPLERMKMIKNHFGVSFSALVMSCVAAGISKRLGLGFSKRGKQEVTNFLLAVVIPLHTRRVERWLNNLTGAAYKLPLNVTTNSVDRLLACDKIIKRVNQSLFTQVVFPALVKLLSFHVYPIARFGFYNREFGAAISNFSVPEGTMLSVNGKYRILKAAAASGTNSGVTGALFCTLGYNGNFHFLVTAAEAVMERNQLKEMVEEMVNEVESLYEQVERSTQNNVEIYRRIENLEQEPWTLVQHDD